MPITLLPFNGGIHEEIDRVLLPDGALDDAVNVELDRGGRLVVRPGFTALGVTSHGSGNVTAYDLFSFNDRLVALGDRTTPTSLGFPTDVAQYTTAGASDWQPSGDSAVLARLPRATEVRDIGRPPEQEGGTANMSVCAAAGRVCLVHNESANGTGYIHLFQASTDQTLLFYRYPATSAVGGNKMRTLALNSRIWVLGLDNDSNDLRGAYIDPTGDEFFNSAVSLQTPTSSTFSIYAAARVAGASEFVAATVDDANNVVVRHYDAGGTLQVPSGGQFATISATDVTAIAVEADSSSDTVTVAIVDDGQVDVYSYTISTGAAIGSAPYTSTEMAGQVAAEVGLCRDSATTLQVCATITDLGTPANPSVLVDQYTVSTGAFAGATQVYGCRLSSSPVAQAGEVVFAARVDADWSQSPNMLLSVGDDTSALDASRRVTPQIAKDIQSADSSSTLLPDLTRDETTGKYYWVNGIKNPDGDTVPVVTEFLLDSTKRRQTAQLGNLVYIGGGVPCVYDGKQVVESGFLTRPEIISLTGSNGDGTLLPGATYDYRLHWEWIDSDGNNHLSPPSEIQSVTLGAAEDTVTAVCSTPHSLRCNSGSTQQGSAVRLVLSRTLATKTDTTPSLTGSESIDPPQSSLDGLTLVIYYNNGSGGNFITVTFDSGSTSIAAVVQDVNDDTSGSVTASADGGFLKLTADDAGEGVQLFIAGGTALSILGFTQSQGATGTSTYTKGENFQRTAVGYVGLTTNPGEYVSVTDERTDQSDPIADADLIRQEVLYSQGVASGAHHAPPPGDCVWAGRDRVWIARQPRRNRITASKIVVPSSPAEFAFDGFLAFHRQVRGDVEGISVIGDSTIVWNRREIWEISGQGPNRAGQGEFFSPRRVSAQGGLVADGWRSLAEEDGGVWFKQSDTSGAEDKLVRLSKSGMVEWMGRAVQDKLATYPVLTAAMHCSSKQSMVFAVQNAAGDEGGLLRYDLDGQAWFFDDVGVVDALAEYDGRIAYAQSGTVYLQDASPGSGTFVPYSATLGMFQGFQVASWGQLTEIGLVLTYRGDCTVKLYLSTDGNDYTSEIADFPITAAGQSVSAGDRFQVMKTPAVQMHDQFAIKVEVTHGSSDSEGVWLHALAFDTEKQPEFARKGAAFRL